VLQTLLNRGLNVRQTEELVRRFAGERKAPSGRRSRPPEESDLEGQLRQVLGTRVTLIRGRRGGRLIIHFYSDELNALVDQILPLQTLTCAAGLAPGPVGELVGGRLALSRPVTLARPTARRCAPADSISQPRAT
jgi:hypothetical protein